MTSPRKCGTCAYALGMSRRRDYVPEPIEWTGSKVYCFCPECTPPDHARPPDAPPRTYQWSHPLIPEAPCGCGHWTPSLPHMAQVVKEHYDG